MQCKEWLCSALDDPVYICAPTDLRVLLLRLLRVPVSERHQLVPRLTATKQRAAAGSFQVGLLRVLPSLECKLDSHPRAHRRVKGLGLRAQGRVKGTMRGEGEQSNGHSLGTV